MTNRPIDVESARVDVAADHGENTQSAGVGAVGVSHGASQRISGLVFMYLFLLCCAEGQVVEEVLVQSMRRTGTI
jgi:hypothetical protein